MTTDPAPTPVTGVYVIVEQHGTQDHPAQVPAYHHAALDGETVDDVLRRCAVLYPVESRLVGFDDALAVRVRTVAGIEPA